MDVERRYDAALHQAYYCIIKTNRLPFPAEVGNSMVLNGIFLEYKNPPAHMFSQTLDESRSIASFIRQTNCVQQFLVQFNCYEFKFSQIKVFVLRVDEIFS